MVNAELCSMHVVVTSATRFECAQAMQQIQSAGLDTADFNISFHQSGVGMLASAVSLTKLALQKPSLIIQAGIAGCFDNGATLGEVYVIGNEMLGDTGVNENGEWKDLFDLNLAQADSAPFTNKGLQNPWLSKYNLLELPVINSITINEITTSPQRRQQIVAKYNPFIESMEGASLHYTCLQQNIPFIQLRATSNYIGERDKTKWKMKDAISNLNNVLVEYLSELKVKSEELKVDTTF